MRRRMRKVKVHRATVTDADLHYVGPITLDPVVMHAADIAEHEQVHVDDANQPVSEAAARATAIGDDPLRYVAFAAGREAAN